ncbi:DedA family protein [Kineococcus rhizosphaerae]|uniref:Membrane protein DedA with SNARE-associated domain n=1 Tax=Kineococcus rhizosphaerae TaxID=559628 RepID=A0A2T0QZ58_9ACTN|nr:DedA family protein [Kineococcus rhizosphaerae]PRY11807.1 membrane protein DedA with SNARE-associated domain [Kineococcus rhizosphaerae]
MFDQLNALVTEHAGAPWVLAAVLALAALDAFVPPLPSESVVIGLAAIAADTGHPDRWALFACALVGAFVGDNLTYAMGRHSPLRRWIAGHPRLERAFTRAAAELDKRGAFAVLAARYVPIGRIAVNLTAGAVRFPRRRFVPLSALAACTWAAYSIAIGSLAGHWIESTPLVGAALGIVIALALGFVVDALLNRFVHERRRA